LADTLDSFVQAGGFMGAGTVRQTQIRYTWLLPMGINAAASVENSASGGIIGTDATGFGATNITANDFNAPGLSQRIPAVTGRVAMQQPWGHVSFALAVMQERLQNDGPGGSLLTTNALPGGAHLKRWGYQMAFSGHYNTFGKDKINWSIGYGLGAAQYSWPLNQLGAQWEEGLVCNLLPGNRLECSQPRVFGVNAGYSHFWTDEWRTGVSFGYDTISRPNAAGAWSNATAGVVTGNASLARLDHRHYSAGISTFWTPVSSVQFGIGYLYYHREVWSGARGNAHRLLSQAVFRF
jgi:hypothetical protein